MRKGFERLMWVVIGVFVLGLVLMAASGEKDWGAYVAVVSTICVFLFEWRKEKRKERREIHTLEPLVAEEHGDVLWFDSARSAAEYVEAVDVRNAEYRFYDAKGFRIAAEVYGDPETVRFVRSGVPAREELAGILSRYCESLHLHPASDSLEDLLVAAKTKARTG